MSSHSDMVNHKDGKGVQRLCQNCIRQVFANRVFNKLRGDGLGARALRGSGWTMAGFGAQQVMRLGSNLILTRLLFPEAFGLMALASVFLAGLEMFSDIGIRTSIIQNARGEDVDFLNTAWTIQVLRGLFLSLVGCALAYPVSILYAEPVLFPLLCVISSTAAIRGFQTTGYALSNRKIQLGKLTIVDLVTQGIGILVMVGWAIWDPTVWALAGGGVVSATLSVVIAHRVLNTHRHCFRWDPTAVRDLVRFGKWIFLSSSVTFLSKGGDRAALPKILNISELSFYSLALMLAQIPTMIFGQIAGRVLYPAYSEAFNKGELDKIGKIITRFSIVSCPAYLIPLIYIFFSDYIVDTLYDPRYRPTADALSLLGVSAWFAMLRSGQSGLLLAAGNSRAAFCISLSGVVLGLPIAILIGMHLELAGFCAGMVVSEAITFLVQRYMVRRTLPSVRARTDLFFLIVLLAVVLLKIFFVTRA